MSLLLERFAYDPDYTMGRLVLPDRILFTIEQPWNNNTPGKSCVPDGEYDLLPHSSDDHPDVWALVNHALGVAHFPTAGVPRAACLIHQANWARQLRGCIAPGLEKGPLQQAGHGWDMAVMSSGVALNILRSHIKTLKNPKLLIRPCEGAKWVSA